MEEQLRFGFVVLHGTWGLLASVASLRFLLFHCHGFLAALPFVPLSSRVCLVCLSHTRDVFALARC